MRTSAAERDSLVAVSDLAFTDLPKIATAGELRHVHRTAGLFLVKRSGKAHSSMTCTHNSDTDFVDNPVWRVATDAQCRKLSIPWCDVCDT
jgi:hypothetical protein